MGRDRVDVAVVGAGIAGMTAAAELSSKGLSVQIFEKSRGPGGRASSRRRGELRFDHGAPFFESEDSDFKIQVQSWLQDGVVRPWNTHCAMHRDGTILEARSAAPYLPLPKMSSLARAIGAQLEVLPSTRIASLHPVAAGEWELRGTQGQSFRAGRVLLTAPPPQSIELLDTHAPLLTQALKGVGVLPDWCLMMAGNPELLPAELGWLDFEDHPVLRRILADHRKIDRPTTPLWVVHGTSSWSQEHVEQSPEWVLQEIGSALESALGKPCDLSSAQAHRWRYARIARPLKQPFLANETKGLYYCGDSCLRGDLESAYLSARQAAGAIAS